MFHLTVPAVLCTFNRYDTSMEVFAKIREAAPSKLYLVSDAARESKENEKEIVERIRTEIENGVDWPCELVKVYADQNMGCARRITSALDYVFEREESAIILEDDCLPADSFFEYCQTLLEQYRNDDRIMSVGGSTIIDYRPQQDIDYYFTTEFCCCGWATWRRAWKLFDFDMKDYPEKIKEEYGYIKKTVFSKKAFWNYTAQWKQLYQSEKKSSWAYIFFYESIIHHKLHIMSSVNLIKNLGFDKEATHTGKPLDYYVTDIQELSFPLRAPDAVERNVQYDSQIYRITQKAGLIIKIKELLGLDINKSIFKR
ncbi:MAG: hypothetical protein IK014_12990 [Lachnospiraceae bacterium]|nr:hypothetical protein [Lachnospiraceae bacterium]